MSFYSIPLYNLITNFFLNLPAEIYTSVLVVILLSIFSIYVGSQMKKADPLKKPSTIVWLGETIVSGIENFIVSMGGNKLKYLTPYFMTLALYIPFSFITGMFGLPSPINYYGVPMLFATATFLLVHATAVRYQKWGYFKRFTAPFAIFLPINLLTFLSPIVSLSFRMFGNALAGTIILSMIYWATGNATEILFNLLGIQNLNFLGPIVAPVFHAYFDLFGALIQTLVFLSLSVLFISAEIPSENN
jgi:F-type H+-transporting ATPase subunit a